MNRFKITLATIAVGAVLYGCEFDPGPFFTPPEIPENQSAFNGGRIGLLTPHLTLENKLIAFRLLSGLTMAQEPDSLGRRRSIVAEPSTSSAPGFQAWLAARSTIPDPPTPTYISAYRDSHTGNNYVFYLNCLDAAFETAARTLQDRRAVYRSDVLLKQWAVAQDQVFANCSAASPGYPDPLPSSSPALARADREYQIAAAHFYAQDLADAEKRFQSIAQDPHSPWQRYGAYLVGRTLLREASLQNNPSALAGARRQFNGVVNTKAGPLAASARGLIEHLDAIEHADATLKSLSDRLLAAHAAPASLENTLEQSAFILRAPSFAEALNKAGSAESFAWVRTLENQNAQYAWQQWKSNNSIPWLTLSLMSATGKDPEAPAMAAEADRLPENSPAFGTATYNSIRLHLERGETDSLPAQLDKLLANAVGRPDSLVNAWRAERMRVATSFDDFLRWAPRTPIDPYETSGLKPPYASPLLAYDSAYVLNYLTPLAKLNDAALSNRLPAWSRANVALAGWTRAFMLDDINAVHEFATLVAKSHPDWATSVAPQSAADLAHWKFKAALLIALHGTIAPIVSVDYGVPWNSSRWWCQVTEPPGNIENNQNDEHNWIAWRLPVMFTPSGKVLTAADRESAKDQLRQLHQKGSAASFLAPIIFSWAKSHPRDSLVPQALHRVVVITRYGCARGDPSTQAISKAAFDLLHNQYPKSPWTAETPYWF